MENMWALSGGKGTWYLRLVSVVEGITKCIWPSLGGLDMQRNDLNDMVIIWPMCLLCLYSWREKTYCTYTETFVFTTSPTQAAPRWRDQVAVATVHTTLLLPDLLHDLTCSIE